jgi:hypothetical protein
MKKEEFRFYYNKTSMWSGLSEAQLAKMLQHYEAINEAILPPVGMN